jgi:peptidoglycan-associated lipoprotein
MRKSEWSAIVMAMILPAVLFTASCTKKMVKTEAAQTVQSGVPKAPDNLAADKGQIGRQQADQLRADADALEAAGTAFLDENINFAFDSAVLSDNARQILNRKADYLRTYPGINVTVEGHCDERGTEAYNIALGERRAQSVKNFLVNLGISTDRLNTVSYGEERPVDKGHNEASWAKNRRAQFVIN